MKSIGLFVIAFGIVLARGTVAALQRSSRPSARRLLRIYGPQPTGADGQWLRRDHLRAAGWHALSAMAAWIIGLAGLSAADHWPTGTRQNTIASFPGLALSFLGCFFAWASAREIGRARRSRSEDAADRRSRPST